MSYWKTMLLIFFVFLSGIEVLWAKVESNTFRIVISPYSMKITTPDASKIPVEGSMIRVVIENESMVKVWGKVESLDKEFQVNTNIPNEQSQTIDIKYKKGMIYQFVSLSPSFQEAFLKVGGKSYEIPAKK